MRYMGHFAVYCSTRVIGRVGHDDLLWQSFDERRGLWRLAGLTSGETEADGTTQTARGEMDFGR